MKTLILGGSYFIGRALIETLASESDNDIWVLNRGSRVIPSSLQVKQLVADRHSKQSLKLAFTGQRFDVVYDLSGYNAEDVAKTSRLLKGKVEHYIFLSSIAVCKQPPSSWPITEEHEKCSSIADNEYGFHKWEAEQYLFDKASDGWSNITTVRPVYVYGPRNYAKREMYIFDRIISGLPIVILGTGENIVQLGYVHDLASALGQIKGNSLTYGQSFNVSGRELPTVNQIINVAEALIGKEATIIRTVDQPDMTKDASGFPDVDRYADNSKIATMLGITPKWSLATGMEESLRYFMEEGD